MGIYELTGSGFSQWNSNPRASEVEKAQVASTSFSYLAIYIRSFREKRASGWMGDQDSLPLVVVKQELLSVDYPTMVCPADSIWEWAILSAVMRLTRTMQDPASRKLARLEEEP